MAQPQRRWREQSEKDTGIQITTTNKTLKQQSVAAAGIPAQGDAESVAACFSTLKAEGFDDQTARRFAKAYPIGQVLNQIEWLPMRGAARNRVGLLRRAIEQDWTKPVSHAGRSTVNRTGTDPAPTGTIEQARRRLAYQLTLKQR